jgi:hypothetical protein
MDKFFLVAIAKEYLADLHHIPTHIRVYPKVIGLAVWSENCK